MADHSSKDASSPEQDTTLSLANVLPMPRSRIVLWVNIALSLIVATIGFGVGFGEGILSAQQIILFGIISALLLFLLLNYVATIFDSRAVIERAETEAQKDDRQRQTKAAWRNNRIMALAMVSLLILYLLLTASIEEFRSIKNLIAFLVLELILLFAFKVSGYFASGRSAFIGLIVLGALIVISSFSIEGFLSAPNVRAILLFAAFLGIASVGQTMVAL
jgi:ribose transport system permease protein